MTQQPSNIVKKYLESIPDMFRNCGAQGIGSFGAFDPDESRIRSNSRPYVIDRKFLANDAIDFDKFIKHEFYPRISLTTGLDLLDVLDIDTQIVILQSFYIWLSTTINLHYIKTVTFSSGSTSYGSLGIKIFAPIVDSYEKTLAAMQSMKCSSADATSAEKIAKLHADNVRMTAVINAIKTDLE